MKLLMPPRYIDGYSIKVTHPDWIGFKGRHTLRQITPSEIDKRRVKAYKYLLP